MYFEGVLFGFPRSRLGPPEHGRVELKTFTQQNWIISKLWLVTRRKSRNVIEQPVEGEARVSSAWAERRRWLTALEANVKKCRLRISAKSKHDKTMGERGKCWEYPTCLFLQPIKRVFSVHTSLRQYFVVEISVRRIWTPIERILSHGRWLPLANSRVLLMEQCTRQGDQAKLPPAWHGSRRGLLERSVLPFRYYPLDWCRWRPPRALEASKAVVNAQGCHGEFVWWQS
jgi:hypothetical protein